MLHTDNRHRFFNHLLIAFVVLTSCSSQAVRLSVIACAVETSRSSPRAR
jgi:hypothetical protein